MMDAVIPFLAAAIVAGTPLLFATTGEIITERVGNLNLGLEGMMMMGAVAAFQVSLISGSPILALLTSCFAGAVGALIFAVLTVSLRANQVVSGLTLAIFGTGFSGFVGKRLSGQVVPPEVKEFFTPFPFPGLSEIPVIGPVFFRQDIFVYLGYVVVVIVGIYLYKTRFGLNLRAIGENPAAADAASISINLYKYVHILLGGALCGLAGAYLSLVYVPAWQENITAGRGWIAVALVIFATWNPYKALLGSYLFGGLDIIGFRIQGYNFPIPLYFIDMLPYLATAFILVVISMRKSKENAPPKALGQPYFREDR